MSTKNASAQGEISLSPKQRLEGASRYIVGDVRRFDQKNEAFKRSRWDRKFYDWGKKLWGEVYPDDRDGHSLLDMAFKNAGWHMESGFAHGNITQGTGMYAWDMKLSGVSKVPKGLKMEVMDSVEMSKHVKKVGKHFGASQIGICEIDSRWVYSKTFHFVKREHQDFELPEGCKYAIVIIVEMDYEVCKQSPNWLAEAAEGHGYSMMAVYASMLAQFIRGLGYKAMPSGNDSALDIPLAIDAGLGELGRSGLLITREYGPRVRISKVFTDLPLVPDEPIEFGVLRFCSTCGKCAKNCPGHAIMHGERTNEPHNMSNASGQLKWPINAEKCFAFWAKNEGTCMNCIRVCPFNKPSGWLHSLAKWGVKHTPWLDSLFLRADDLIGYGKQLKSKQFWDI